ncbi:type I-E CRISPR-associated protein Cse1/CasA, partial [Sutterella sp.]|uniref:type I-E CRISPR-associated protein Cse1/CasA n=1 Tax=Sutterella sp. TaxID=1981025 RepID=UPI0026DF031C
MIGKSFNLSTEKWLKLARQPPVSLIDFFNLVKAPVLEGTPIERLSVFRLLLAILQRACRPKTEVQIKQMNIEKMKSEARAYLTEHMDEFDIYDEKKPFLQYTDAFCKDVLPSGKFVIGVAGKSAVVLREGTFTRNIGCAEEAYVLLTQLVMGTGGKKVKNNIRIKKTGTPPSSPAMGKNGWLHIYPLGDDLFDTLRINLISEMEIKQKIPYLTSGIGIPPWEKMPMDLEGDEGEIYKNSLIGRLIPLAFYCHFDKGKFHIVRGLSYSNPCETARRTQNRSTQKTFLASFD